MSRVRVCGLAEMTDVSARRVMADGHPVALIRIGDDLYAVGDTCSHEDYSLAEGEVFTEEREIECWKHGSTFSLESGEPQCLPATKPIPVYDVEVEGDDVYVVIR